MRIRNLKSILMAGFAMAMISAALVTTSVEAAEIDTVSENLTAAALYKNELTGEPISIAVQNQRPVAIMVDNETTALPHFGTNQADIVYEMVNSTANGRITRLMCIYKNWQNITQVGSVRSVRPTNLILAAEYNAVICHDGGPFYINQYLRKGYTNNLSGGFARFSNGKRTEYTEYVTLDTYVNPTTKKSYMGLYARIKGKGYSTDYNDYSLYKSTPHFNFSETEINLDGKAGVIPASEADLPFPHNSSKVIYNAATNTYDYYEYGSAHIDALTNEVTSFKNVIIMKADMSQLDAHGYMVYGMLNADQPAYYMTNGKAIPITWTKLQEVMKTEYMEANNTPLTMNTGKTYIAIVPSDAWTKLVIK